MCLCVFPWNICIYMHVLCVLIQNVYTKLPGFLIADHLPDFQEEQVDILMPSIKMVLNILFFLLEFSILIYVN